MFEVLVIGDDGDRVRRSNEPGTHISESVDNRQKFLVVDVVVDFRRGEFS